MIVEEGGNNKYSSIQEAFKGKKDADKWIAEVEDEVFNIKYYIDLPRDGAETSSKGLDGGHVFLGIEKMSKKSGITEETIVGFYPGRKEGVLTKTLPGLVRSDNEHAYDYSYNIKITEEQYKNAMSFLKTTSAKPPEYNLRDFNCVDFAHDVGKAAGVELPGGNNSPYSTPYVSLQKMNFFYGSN